MMRIPIKIQLNQDLANKKEIFFHQISNYVELLEVPNAHIKKLVNQFTPVMWIPSDPHSFGSVDPDSEVKNEGKSRV